MRLRFSLLVLCLVSTAGAEPSAFDRLDHAYAPYLDHNDGFAWPAKVRALRADEYRFWRGSKDLFFLWCNDHCADWSADPTNVVASHGDLHMGNIGAYASDAGLGTVSSGTVAFGMVDFDDAIRLPFQIELLQGFITLRLMAREASFPVDAATTARVDAAILDTYRAALISDKTTTELLADDADLAGMIHRAADVSYASELDKCCDGDRFKPAVRSGSGKVSDVLRAVDASKYDAFADGIAQACANEPAVAKQLRSLSAADWRKRIKGVALRSRFGSAGSQGLNKFLVLVDHPFVSLDSDAILYFKQEIPTAAERAGYVPLDPRSPGERAKRLMDDLTMPHTRFNSWATVEGKSYWVSLKEPWSDEMTDAVASEADLLHAARVWGTVAGAAQRSVDRATRLLPRLTDALARSLAERADTYLAKEHDDFAAFVADPRTTVLKRRADEAIDGLLKSVR